MKISHGDDLTPLNEGSWRDRDGDIWVMGQYGCGAGSDHQ